LPPSPPPETLRLMLSTELSSAQRKKAITIIQTFYWVYDIMYIHIFKIMLLIQIFGIPPVDYYSEAVTSPKPRRLVAAADAFAQGAVVAAAAVEHRCPRRFPRAGSPLMLSVLPMAAWPLEDF
jgi:hypothetical protein